MLFVYHTVLWFRRRRSRQVSDLLALASSSCVISCAISRVISRVISRALSPCQPLTCAPRVASLGVCPAKGWFALCTHRPSAADHYGPLGLLFKSIEVGSATTGALVRDAECSRQATQPIQRRSCRGSPLSSRRAWVPIAQQWRMYPAAADGYRFRSVRFAHGGMLVQPFFCWPSLSYRLFEPSEHYAAHHPARALPQHRHHGPH